MANRISFVLEIATASAVQNLVQLSKELGNADISAQDVAKALRQAADDAEEEIRKINTAAEAMGAALGSEFVDAAAKAGTSVDDIVVQLRSLGVSFDDIEANADELAAAVKRLDDVRQPVQNLGDEASATAGQLDKVRDSGDQSGSVLANMVGNSVQEVGELGGVAGTAGMALGQLAEYATEGNISLAGLAKVAGPMAGVTAAVLGVSWAVGKLKEESEKAKRAGEGMLDVQEKLRDGNFDAAASKLQEEWGGTISVLEDMGFTTEQVIRHLTGQGDITAELTRKIDAHRSTLDDDIVAQEKYDQAMASVLANLGLATTAFEEQGTTLETTTRQTNAISTALTSLASTSEATATSLGVVDRSAADFADEADRAKRSTEALDSAYRDLTDALSADRAWLDVERAIDDYNLKINEAGASNRDKRLALIDLKQSLIDYLGSLEDVPAEKQTEILALIDQAKFDEAETALANLTRARNVTVNTNVIAPGGRYVPGGSNIVGAEGGIVNRPTVALIGEAGPEAVVPLHRTAGNGPLPVGIGGATNHFYITNQIKADPNGVVQSLKQYERINGTRWRRG